MCPNPAVVQTPYADVEAAYNLTDPQCTGWMYSNYNGYKHLASGLCCGISALAAGLCIGIAGDAGVRANAHRDIYVGLILILIFGEALGLYGLIIAIILSANANPCSEGA